MKVGKEPFENNKGTTVLMLFSALKNMLSSTELHLTSVWSETASYVKECKMFRFVKS